MTKRYYSYQEFLADTHTLTQKIHGEFDAIVAIARGGMSLAQLLGEYYNLRSVYTINTIGYEGSQKLEGVEVFNLPNLAGATQVLIVDDIVDSGDTLSEVLRVLNEAYPQIRFRSASLFYKQSANRVPDWYVQEAGSDWIEFFWSEDMIRKQ